jgi:peptidoglycan/xylan/chitin deacetylase (PgdA/CDA1 family)
MSEPEIRHSIRLCDNVLLNSVGFIPKLYRAPYGEWTEEAKFVLSSLGKTLIQWSFDSRDWESLDSNQIYRAAESQMLAFKHEEHNWISLFHDLYQETASSLDRIISSALSLGYSFVTISDCMSE